MSTYSEKLKDATGLMAPKYVSRARGRKLMRAMVRLLEAKYGNPPRRPIYDISK